ncbi:hypothetical protein OIE62_39250 [Streptomyces scopuliridis]|uniref:Uncharacterized protein n=1 Tax=Streptomyces scopuliridis TaxID=452529 RepID=A0ACD4ZBT7_9ACTN|nr:hypothetical protein [Streptomyces scopuliridis]WSB95855.1 hypothetical protein OG835_01675 [Streptomyces scopuliridis]WSC10438.1 hypothetical protein OIE62_39250 [Streptomyces scopuliridis]
MLAWAHTVRTLAGGLPSTESDVRDAVQSLRHRYPRLGDQPQLGARWGDLSSTHAHVAGIAHWLDRTAPEQKADA